MADILAFSLYLLLSIHLLYASFSLFNIFAFKLLICYSCKDLLNNYTCTCMAGYTGRNCETEINECLVGAQPKCVNNGTCVDKVGLFNITLDNLFLNVDIFIILTPIQGFACTMTYSDKNYHMHQLFC